jgi:hypothetical protein
MRYLASGELRDNRCIMGRMFGGQRRRGADSAGGGAQEMRALGASPRQLAAAFTLLALLMVLGSCGLLLAQADNLAAGAAHSTQQATTPTSAPRRPSPAAPGPGAARLAITVLDENKVAVQFAQVTLVNAAGGSKCETDSAGRCDLTGLVPGSYDLRAEKEGYFAAVEKKVQVGATEAAEITLNHQRELVKHVDVIYSPPAIDPEKTTLSNTLSARELIDLPYSVPRDLRYLLPMLPGVLPDNTAQIHVDGSASPQTLYQLDGFTINAPESRDFITRVSVDSVRSITLQNSRYPVEHGLGTGGVLSLTTGMGDDRFRFVGTDFIPSMQGYQGLHIGVWTPRVMVTGPLRKGKAWFLIAPEGEYNLNIIRDLPAGQNQVPAWRYGTLAKAQVNLTHANILTGTALFNGFGEDHAGLSLFNPVSTTVDLRQSNHLLAIKDVAFLRSGMLLDVGLAETAFYTNTQPQGNELYVLTPNGSSGNYFESAIGRSGRLEGLANLTVLMKAAGRHQLKLGTNLDRITYQQSTVRNPFVIERADGTRGQTVTFSGPPSFTQNNFTAGVYAQDLWSPSQRMTLAPGVRLDWDEIVGKEFVSPRLAATYLLERGGETKIVAGAGLYYDATDLGTVSLPLQGERMNTFYDSTGTTPVGPPVVTSFQLPSGGLEEPHVLNWSVGVERKLPGSVYSDFEFLEKRGEEGFAYFNSCTEIGSCLNGMFTLRNLQSAHYHAGRVTARKYFKGNHFVFASYTESRASSSAVLSFNLENQLFSPQLPGPPPWDSPHRLVSWGFLPLVRGYDLAYTVDVRSGYPFYLVNENQQLVGPPGVMHFPTYFSLNLAIEKRFHLFGFEWALRAGFDNITNHDNPTVVNNNVDSPEFLTYAGSQGHVLTARIRLLGRK